MNAQRHESNTNEVNVKVMVRLSEKFNNFNCQKMKKERKYAPFYLPYYF